MFRILIAEDHAVVRSGVRKFVEAGIRGCEVGEAASAADAIAQLEQSKWNLLLLDIHMPGQTGLEILAVLKARFPETRVLVLSGLPERQYAIDVVRAGAAGYISKSSAPAELVNAIQKVLSGQGYASPDRSKQMAQDVGRSLGNGSRFEELSAREVQVFTRLAGGTTITGVATELSLSVKTVSTYRARIMEKMGFTTNAEITSYAIRHGIDTSGIASLPSGAASQEI